jgi:2-polyprenyl-6-methoxyphenol hydroxylase-like FAD-dependent oxidoreductase
MRSLFLEGIEGNVRWSHSITGYELLGDGVRAIFADGSKSEEGSMLVGGEGIRSHVAKKLSDGKIKVFDLGARGIHGKFLLLFISSGLWMYTIFLSPPWL